MKLGKKDKSHQPSYSSFVTHSHAPSHPSLKNHVMNLFFFFVFLFHYPSKTSAFTTFSLVLLLFSSSSTAWQSTSRPPRPRARPRKMEGGARQQPPPRARSGAAVPHGAHLSLLVLAPETPTMVRMLLPSQPVLLVQSPDDETILDDICLDVAYASADDAVADDPAHHGDDDDDVQDLRHHRHRYRFCRSRPSRAHRCRHQ